MLKVQGSSIFMPSGDSGTFNITVRETDALGVQHVRQLVSGDVITFTVKRTLTKTAEIIIQKVITTFEDGIAVVRIKASDTENIMPGRLFYEVELMSPTDDPDDPDVDTFLTGEFNIEADLG